MYHVLNRSVAGMPFFRKRADYEVFERMMIEAHQRRPLPILAWFLMRAHWHFAVCPNKPEPGENIHPGDSLSDSHIVPTPNRKVQIFSPY